MTRLKYKCIYYKWPNGQLTLLHKAKVEYIDKEYKRLLKKFFDFGVPGRLVIDRCGK